MKPRTLVLGAASWNRMVHVESLPQGQSATIFNAIETEGAGSTGIGKAAALAALGHDVTLQCALGGDNAARRIAAFCADRNIRLIVDEQDAPTPRHLNIMDIAGGRYSLFVEPGAQTPDINVERIIPLIREADAIFLSLAASSLPLLEFVKTRREIVQLDLHDYDGENPWYEPFIAAATSIQVSDVALSDPAQLASHLLSGLTKDVTITRAEIGATIVTRDQSFDIPAAPASFLDSNGAGDAFAVGFWHARYCGHDLHRSGAFASALAAIAIECDEIFPVSVEENLVWNRAGLI